MPGFVKNPKDESRWERAKKAAQKTTSEGSDSFYALSNFIYHKMGKTEEDMQKAEEFKKSLLTIPKATKMPKQKSMPKATDKPSLFFKKEDFDNIKRPSIENLRGFLEKNRSKKKDKH